MEWNHTIEIIFCFNYKNDFSMYARYFLLLVSGCDWYKNFVRLIYICAIN